MALNGSNMEYFLNYCFNGKRYSIKEFVPQKASTNQLEAVADGLAVSSAEYNRHSPYGKYTDMHLYENGEEVWTAEMRIISANHAYTQEMHQKKFNYKNNIL